MTTAYDAALDALAELAAELNGLPHPSDAVLDIVPAMVDLADALVAVRRIMPVPALARALHALADVVDQ